VLPVIYELLQVDSISQLTVSRLSRQCEILNISQPYRPPRPVMGQRYFMETECADCLDNVKSLTSHNPIGLQGLLRE
jgi:hypothetical protein